MTTNILVTGGLGVNGAWVIRKMIERGLEPIVFENRIDMSLLGAEWARKATIVEGDVTDLDALVSVFRDYRIECVVHMAAMISGMQEDPLKGFSVNALGTVHVLEAASIAGVERIVYTSSRAAYGHIDGRAAHPHYEPITEAHPQRPRRVYDVCKVASEGMGRNYAQARGLQFVALRFAQIFGPGKLSRHESLGIMSRLIENPMAGHPVRIPHGGDQRDDVIYVDDAAEAIVVAALHTNPHYDAYNISRGVGTTLNDFADAVRAVVPEADIEIGPGLDYHGLGVVCYYGVMDNQRAREDLGFSPRYDLAAGVAHYVDAMHDLGLEPVVT